MGFPKKNSAENLCIIFLQEQDILDMIAQCEADEMDGKNMASNKIKGPKVRKSIQYFFFKTKIQGICKHFVLGFCHGFVDTSQIQDQIAFQ